MGANGSFTKYGLARPGEAWSGRARRGKVRLGSQWLIIKLMEAVRQGSVRYGMVRRGRARHGSQWLVYKIDGSGSVGCGEVRQGAAWHGKAREPMAHKKSKGRGEAGLGWVW
jgi:hypothetical protein